MDPVGLGNPADYYKTPIATDVLLSWFDKCDAVWLHGGDPEKPHAELTSGMCSNGYFDCPRVLRHPTLNEVLARQLVQRLAENEIKAEDVDWVIGSPYAAITLSYEVAKALGAVHAFAEKDPSDPKGKKMVWRRMVIPPGARVLQIEELITTSGTFKEVRRAIEQGNSEPVEFLPVVGVLVHRPPKLPADYGDVQIIPLIEKEVWAVDPKDCPLCKAGSRRVRPKSHWAELTGKA